MTHELWSKYEASRSALFRESENEIELAFLEISFSGQGSDLSESIDRIAKCFSDGGLDKSRIAEAYSLLVSGPVSVDLLYEYVEHRLLSVCNNIEQKGRFDGWDWSYLAEAAITAFETTGQRRFADLVWTSFEAALEVRDCERGWIDSVRGRALYSWGRGDHVADQWTAVVTTAGRMAYPVFRLARISNEKGVRALDQGKRDEMVDKAELALLEFEDDFRVIRNGQLGFYERPTRGDIEPLKYALSAGRAWLELAALRGDPRARKRAELLARFFRWAIFKDPSDAYVWAYQPTPDKRKTRRPNLVWKADVDLSFALLAVEHRCCFNNADVYKFCRTFRNNIELPDGALNSYIGRQKVVPIEHKLNKAKRRTHGLLTWMMLSPWDPRIGERIDREVAENRIVFDEGWFGSARGSYAYALRLNRGVPVSGPGAEKRGFFSWLIPGR